MLDVEIEKARKEIVSDGYDMSVGELINLYRDKEIKIDPEYQRLFRWKDEQKTRFIETLLLGLPVPPIFVFQTAVGKWELIDGLQRTSTILQFVGILDNSKPLELNGTKYLPSLAGKYWENQANKKNGIGSSLQIQFKRQRMRVEILKKESDNNAKYELFQRLNTGGSTLSEQEVRHCVIVMLNPSAAKIIHECATNLDFSSVTNLTEEQCNRKFDEELVIRYFAISTLKYQSGLDVHEFLDEAAKQFCDLSKVKQTEFKKKFSEIFKNIHQALGKAAFRSTPTGVSGQFQLAKYETVVSGIAWNWPLVKVKEGIWVKTRVAKLFKDPIYVKNSGAGIRGTTRFANLIPLGIETFSK